MKNILLLSGFLLILGFHANAQEFAPVSMNPFGLTAFDPDNSGFHVRYADMDGDDDLDAVHFGLEGDTFFLSIQPNIGTSSSPNFGLHQRTDLSNTYDLALLFPDLADINQDGKVDILAFGAVDSTQGYGCVLFTNTSSGGDLTFQRSRGDSIGLPSVGDGIFIPEIVDMNMDGDFDVLLSGLLNNIAGDDTDGVIYYAQNLGNISEPSYAGWYEEAYGVSILDTFQLAISTTGDLDNDGDIDILSLIAETDEVFKYYYFKNEAASGQKPAYAEPAISPFNLTDSFGLPDLIDIDADGDLDLFLYMGESGVAFFENISCVENSTEFNGVLCYGDTIHLGGLIFDDVGVFRDTLQNQGGCDSTVTYNVSAIMIDLTVSLTDMILSASHLSADAYQWIDCSNNTPIDGATEATFTPTASGSYAVIISQDHCTFQSECTMVILSGIRDFSDLGIVVFPNPADEKITFEGINEITVNQASLVNSSGKSYSIEVQQNELDVSILPTGLYIIQLIIDEQVYITRVTIR